MWTGTAKPTVRMELLWRLESTEIVGYVPEFIAQVLVPMVRSGEIASIDAVRTDMPRNAHQRYMGAYQICGCKNKKEEEKD